MPSYLVETFLPRTRARDRAAQERAARSAAAVSTRAGTPIRVGRSVYVPDDEICLFRVDAPSAADVEHLVASAGAPLLRVVEAISSIR